MAKIFKVSGYFVDANGDYDVDSLEAELGNSVDMIPKHLHIDEADIGEWEDDNPLNYNNCDLEECEKHFKEDPTDGGDR